MTQQQKQEEKLNKLLSLIKPYLDNMSKDNLNCLSITQFLYSVGRLNTLQVAVRLSKVASDCNIDINDIVKALEG